MLPDGGKICETETPPWRASSRGHRILCHIPLEELEKMDPVISTPAAAA
jgi:peptide/nickel transport system ATP-binding protein